MSTQTETRPETLEEALGMAGLGWIVVAIEDERIPTMVKVGRRSDSSSMVSPFMRIKNAIYLGYSPLWALQQAAEAAEIDINHEETIPLAGGTGYVYEVSPWNGV